MLSNFAIVVGVEFFVQLCEAYALSIEKGLDLLEESPHSDIGSLQTSDHTFFGGCAEALL